ncbi:phage major tail protein, TP901-1 family [Amorphus orientalis]|uniref:TP901-1 family phage major tail protein n=1 Tax=Amorphus orientalis TaxID=649198 RepID=A0AAE4AV36_9HYPH|nr:phage major tail protein, TP901-1 family [Amorphus orientalis]MDQ0317832.1 TP901-1 family phage major tail protein [Amorphus orientalis]
MGAQRGTDLVLRLDQTGSGSYATVAGLRARRLSFNTDAVDVTDTESAGRWRELLAGAGVKRASLSGSGIFKDAASDAAVRTIFFSGDIRSWQVVIPDFGTVSGPFQLTGLDYAGNHDGEVTYEISLESAGELTLSGA